MENNVVDLLGADQRACLVMSKAEYVRLGDGRKYDDDPSRHYSWDSFVPNFRQVRPRDRTKHRGRCPSCNATGFKRRVKAKPTYRCDCGAEFDVPVPQEARAGHTVPFQSRTSMG
ncbi:hypothetical protein ACWEO2_18400 [Nocardia sp. NPDC004278]